MSALKRTTMDLVEETAQEALSLWVCAIAVGFEDMTKFVFYQPDEALVRKELEVLVKKGGEAIGLIGIEKSPSAGGTTLIVKTRPFDEYAAAPWVEAYLHALVDKFRQLAVATRAM